ncbi:pilus assembly PilX N-terminal domain-containing protein [Aeromonas media]|uniref:pilus assembly PilX N-terminal domain-containing protein n=1 Tax=Aeromonas media TaxID=651 RepID=UPI0038D1FA84
MNRQSGFTTFTVTLILLFILLAVSLLVGKVLVTDRRVALNEVLYRQAMAMAEQGLADGFGRLAIDPSWWTGPSGATISLSGGSYKLIALDDVAVAVGSTVVTPIVVRAEATLNNSQAEAVVQTKVVINNKVVPGSTPAPLMVAGGAVVGSNFTVAANPNGGGLGVPVSIWSDKPVDIGNSAQTCHQDAYDAGSCAAAAISSKKDGKQADIKDNDPTFPTDLLWYLFNEHDDAAGWANLESKANQIVNSCSGLGPTSTGLIIVKGNCDPGANIGTQAAPVVLIIKDGSLKANGNLQLYGLVFAYSSHPATATTDITLNGGAKVNGVLAANYDPKLKGTYDAKYDASVMTNIKNGAAFKTPKQIPGSWRDW